MAKKDIRFMVNDIKEATVEAARTACVDIMNSLSQQGPAWTGKFSSAWYAIPIGSAPGGARSEGVVYKYNLRNVPKSRFRAGTLYQIVNGMSYSDQARDLVEFDSPDKLRTAPIKPVERGDRPPGGRRGELDLTGKKNRRTAPLDWYTTYVNGGNLQKDLSTGARRGFGTYKPRGFA